VEPHLLTKAVSHAVKHASTRLELLQRTPRNGILGRYLQRVHRPQRTNNVTEMHFMPRSTHLCKWRFMDNVMQRKRCKEFRAQRVFVMKRPFGHSENGSDSQKLRTQFGKDLQTTFSRQRNSMKRRCEEIELNGTVWYRRSEHSNLHQQSHVPHVSRSSTRPHLACISLAPSQTIPLPRD
jgi:hypothetical protein